MGRKGFTLIELLVVITLLATIMAIMVSSKSMSNYAASNTANKIGSDLALIQNGATTYNTDKNAYPTGMTDATFVPTYLFAPMVPAGWDATYGTNGYFMGLQSGQATPNNGEYVCARANNVGSAVDLNWLAATLITQQYAPTQYYVNTSCMAVANMAAPVIPTTVYITFWITRY